MPSASFDFVFSRFSLGRGNDKARGVTDDTSLDNPFVFGADRGSVRKEVICRKLRVGIFSGYDLSGWKVCAIVRGLLD